jgi:DNA-binding protein H-NS
LWFRFWMARFGDQLIREGETMARSPSGIDFDGMSDGQLRELMQQVKETLHQRVTQRIDEFRLLAMDAGFELSLRPVGGEPDQRRRRRSAGDDASDGRKREVAPKFRNPDNPAELWAGRGRKPKWVEEKLAAGRQLEDLRINGEPEAA